MVGSHCANSLSSPIEGWVVGGGRMRSILSNTMVLKDGAPWLSLGSPGHVHCTVPQVLSNILDFGMGTYQMSWRAADGTLSACTGPRHEGVAAGF